MINQHYIFKGYDWTELAEALGLVTERPYHEDEHLIEAIRAALRKASRCLSHPQYEDERINANLTVAAARQFVHALIATGVGIEDRPVWRGLAEVEDHHTFLSYLSMMLPAMWT